MPERAYADIVGNFRRAAAGAYAGRGNFDAAAGMVGDDPELMQTYQQMGDRSYARRQRDETDSANRAYAGSIASGDYEGAASIAGKVGSVEGVTGARTAQTQVDQQTRVNVWRGATQNLAELESIEANNGEGYETWLQRGQSALQQNPDMDPDLRRLIETAPPSFNPRFTAAMRAYTTRLRDAALTPEQASQAELTARQRDTQERQADISERRADAAETTANAAMMRAESMSGGGGNLSQQQFSRANSLRDEYNQQTQSYRGIADIVRRSDTYANEVAAGRSRPNSQSDIGLVYALAKVYDPTSVVREGEFATVARSGGMGPQIQGYVNRIFSDGQLPPQIRIGILNSLRQSYRAAQQQYNQVRSRYEGLATQSGIDPSYVIDDYSAGNGASGEAAPGGGANALPPANQRVVGQTYTMPDGQQARWNGPGRGFTPVGH